MSRELAYQVAETELGPLAIAEDDGALLWLMFRCDERFVPDSLPRRDTPLLARAFRQIEEYLEGERREFEGIPLRLEGTGFQRRAWDTLLKIPYGGVMSYGEVAAQMGCRGAARAVGGAVRANPLPIFIPCHRVIAAGERLGGFSSGLDLKRKLLAVEGVEVDGAVSSVARVTAGRYCR